MIKCSVLLLTAFILSLFSPVLAAEPGSGMIEGSVVNKTAGGSSVADKAITLKTYLDKAEVDTAVTTTDAEGRFVFDGLSTAAGYGYDIVLKFQGAAYNSERLHFDEGKTTKSTEIIVYDSTTGGEAINVAMAHMIIYVENDTLLVKEYYLFTNKGDRTYIGLADGGNRGVLLFPLPEGATELQLTRGLMDSYIVKNEKGFAHTMPVLPGMMEVAYSYRVGYSSSTYTFSKMVNYPTTRFDLLIKGEGIEVTSDHLAIDAPMDISGTHFGHLSGEEFAVDRTLVMRLSGLPQAGTQGSTPWVLWAQLVIGAGVVFVYLMRRKRLEPVSNKGGFNLRKQRLLVKLAELDDDFEAGRISEEDHRRLRNEKKAELTAIMHRS